MLLTIVIEYRDKCLGLLDEDKFVTKQNRKIWSACKRVLAKIYGNGNSENKNNKIKNK